jgi:hypothetical protein
VVEAPTAARVVPRQNAIAQILRRQTSRHFGHVGKWPGWLISSFEVARCGIEVIASGTFTYDDAYLIPMSRRHMGV